MYTLQEEIADFERRNEKRTWKELAVVITLRTATNLFTFLVLVAAAVVIFYSTQFGLENVSRLRNVLDTGNTDSVVL